MAASFAQVLTLAPPDIDKPSTDEIWKLLKVGRNVRGLGKKDMMRLLRWGPMAVADFWPRNFSRRNCCAARLPRAEFSARRWGRGRRAARRCFCCARRPTRIRRARRRIRAAGWAR